MTGKPSVLFVCVHNAGRSQMAAGWLRHPAGQPLAVVRGVRDEIRARVEKLITDLL